jgi:hypothetical protein
MAGAASDFFQEIADAPGEMERKLLGPPYNYFKEIKTPSELGMSGKGTLSQLATNVGGLMDYVELLVTGRGGASTTGKPLGNRLFMKTGGTCTDTTTKRQADRYMYIDNVPDGSIPFISGAMGVQFTSFEGLIPGILSDVDQMNPMAIMRGFMEGSEPDCIDVALPVVGQNGVQTTQRHHVPVAELKGISPCLFPGGTNPATKEPCREAFGPTRSGLSLGQRRLFGLVAAGAVIAAVAYAVRGAKGERGKTI